MLLRMLGVAGLVGLLGAAGVRADAKVLAAEMKKFEGTWAFAEFVKDGEVRGGEEIKTYRLVIKADTFENRVEIHSDDAGRWRREIKLGAGGEVIEERRPILDSKGEQVGFGLYDAAGQLLREYFNDDWA